MPDVALALDNVSKKFRRGELHDSLRDLIPDLVKRLGGRRRPETLGEREFWALRDVSFEVERGEAFGIIGRNGAGKSTLLKLLSGIMNPTSGRLSVVGRLSALIEIGAGFHPDLTGRENVFLNGAILGMSRKEIERKFDEIVDFSGIEDFIDTPVKRYSSGMFARLGFSVAAHLEPDVLVIDEVLSVGDALFRAKGVEKMHQVARSGATVVFVSHDLHSVASLCDRCMLLEKGSVVEIGPASPVIQRYLSPDVARQGEDDGKGATISAVAVRGVQGTDVHFQSGDKAWVDIDLQAHEDVSGLSVVLDVADESRYHVFDTSTERLGLPAISLRAGEKARATFELDLHLARATFHVTASIYRYDVQRVYDQWRNAATVFVGSDRDVGGVVNLNPQVEIQAAGRSWTTRSKDLS